MARGLTVPRLDGIPAVCGVRDDEQFRAQLALAMIDAGIAPVSLLNEQPNPAKFISAAFELWLRARGSAQIDRRFAFTAALGSWTRGEGCGHGYFESEVYFLALEAQQAGYAPWAKAFAYLEQWDAQLPATVYSAFGHVHRFGAYDYENAAEHEDMMLDGLDDEDLAYYREEFRLKKGEARVQRPDCLRLSPLTRQQIARRRNRWPDRVQTIVELALALEAASNAMSDPGEEEFRIVRECTGEMSMPLPCFLSSFTGRDAVCAAFDHEAQHMYEEEREPAVMIPILTIDVACVVRAFGRFALCLDVLRCAAALLDSMPSLRRYVIKGRKTTTEARVIIPSRDAGDGAPPASTLWEAA